MKAALELLTMQGRQNHTKKEKSSLEAVLVIQISCPTTIHNQNNAHGGGTDQHLCSVDHSVCFGLISSPSVPDTGVTVGGTMEANSAPPPPTHPHPMHTLLPPVPDVVMTLDVDLVKYPLRRFQEVLLHLHGNIPGQKTH